MTFYKTRVRIVVNKTRIPILQYSLNILTFADILTTQKISSEIVLCFNLFYNLFDKHTALFMVLYNKTPLISATPMPHTSRRPREGEDSGQGYWFAKSRKEMEDEFLQGNCFIVLAFNAKFHMQISLTIVLCIL